MRKIMMLIFLAVAMMFLAMPVYAQGATTAPAQGYWSIAIGAGIGLGIAAGLCGIGQGRATASAVEALARNPGARPGIFVFLIIGLALIESLVL